jgi:hypothetical protein
LEIFDMKKIMSIFLISTFMLFVSASAYAIGISFGGTSGGILEDTILIASDAGDPPRDAIALGDFDLSVTDHVIDIPVDAGTTHWWLIGHEAGDVVYSSNMDLLGVDMYSVEPYDIAIAVDWNIPENLDGYVNGTIYGFDWWAQTVSNHSSHVAADGAVSNLWRFASPGNEAGSVAVSLHTNTPPGIEPGEPIPEPSIILLFGVGLFGLVGSRFRKKFRRD